MTSPTQTATDARRLKQSDDRTRMPLRAVVGRPLPDLDAVQMELALTPGATRLNVRHPYIGPNSWIRVMPERGTMALTMQRGDDIREEIFGYIAPQAHIRIRQYKEGLRLYRPLDSGELELMSSGRAYAFFGGRGDIELRGGAIRHDLMQSNLEIRSIAPTHNRRLHKASSAVVGHEERFGAVKRPDTQKPNLLQKYVRQSDNTFSIEYSRWLSTTTGTALMELQEGHVVDTAGQFVKQASTNKTLRSHKGWFHKQSGHLMFQVDEELNVLLSNASQATETKVELGAKNVLKLTAQDIKATFTKTGTMIYGNSYALRTKAVNVDATTSYTLKTLKAHINSADVGFGAVPVLPIALAVPTAQAIAITANVMQGFVQTVGNALAVAFPPVAVAAQTAAAALAQATATTMKIPSTQVKASG